MDTLRDSSATLDFDGCWEAVQRRDETQDGRFFFGVLTTGIYCRPSCRARMPLRRNVRFYATPEAAERDGLRACKRCGRSSVAATAQAAERLREICRYIETHSDESLSLADLAKEAGMSPFHFQRRFKAMVGVTPKKYVDAARLKQLKRGLRESKDVTTALYDAGFNSASRVYERADTRLGMTPKQYRSAGQGVAITHAAAQTPVGLMMVGATDRGLCFVQFGDSEEELLRNLKLEYPNAHVEPMRTPHHPDFERWIDALLKHLAGTQPRLDLPLDIRATAFQMRVWSYLQSIPYGQVQSYGEVAASIGRPASARAVAQACASNTVALVIPCHRVIRGTGDLAGYRWGLPRKRALIDRERASRATSITGAQ